MEAESESACVRDLPRRTSVRQIPSRRCSAGAGRPPSRVRGDRWRRPEGVAAVCSPIFAAAPSSSALANSIAVFSLSFGDITGLFDLIAQQIDIRVGLV